MIFRKRLYFLEKKHGFLWPFPAKPTPASILRRSTSFDYKDAAEINAPVGRASGVSEKKTSVEWFVGWVEGNIKTGHR
jgi:beta-lactamase class D